MMRPMTAKSRQSSQKKISFRPETAKNTRVPIQDIYSSMPQLPGVPELTLKKNLKHTRNSRPTTGISTKQSLRPFSATASIRRGPASSMLSRRSTVMMKRTGSQAELTSINELPIDIKFMNARQKLEFKTTLSPNTKDQNNIISDTITVLSGQEKRELQQKTQSNLKSIDCTDLIKQADRQLKCLSYRTNCIMPVTLDHILLIPGKPVQIEVIEQTLMVFRVQSRGCLSPAGFKIDYPGAVKKNQIDLKVYVSQVHKEPDEKYHEKSLKVPSFFALKSNDKEGFTSEYVYISFYSVTGCSINVVVKFPEPIRKRLIRRQSTEMEEEDDEEREKRAEEEALLIRQQRKSYATHRMNFIKKNMEEAENYDEVLSERGSYNGKHSLKVASIKQKKAFIEVQKRKKNFFLLHRWDYLKGKRVEFQEAHQQLLREQKHKFDWVRLMLTNQALQHVYWVFDKQREKVSEELKQKFVVFMFTIKFKTYMKKRAKTLEQRNIISMRHAFTFGQTQMGDSLEQQANLKLNVFLKEFSGINDLRSKIIKFRDAGVKIQSQYRYYRDTLENKKEMLSKVLWDKEKSKIFRHCCEKKSQRGTQVLKKLNASDEDTKQAAIKLYGERCRIRAYVRMLEWSLDFRMGTATDEKIDRVKALIEKFKLKQVEMEKKLFLNVWRLDEQPPVQQNEPVVNVVAPANAVEGARGRPVRTATVPVKKGKKKGKKKKGKKKGAKGQMIEYYEEEEEEEVNPKNRFDPVKHMQGLVKFNEEDINADLPALRFIPNEGVLERLIIRVTFAKGPEDFDLP